MWSCVFYLLFSHYVSSWRRENIHNLLILSMRRSSVIDNQFKVLRFVIHSLLEGYVVHAWLVRGKWMISCNRWYAHGLVYTRCYGWNALYIDRMSKSDSACVFACMRNNGESTCGMCILCVEGNRAPEDWRPIRHSAWVDWTFRIGLKQWPRGRIVVLDTRGRILHLDERSVILDIVRWEQCIIPHVALIISRRPCTTGYIRCPMSNEEATR